jgi:DNA-binding MarR family transcriptional regulator
MPRLGLTDDDYARLAAFRHRIRRFLHFSESAAESMGITAQQYHALLVVRVSTGATHMTINDLASQLFIKHNSAVGLVDRLVDQGLLLRKPATDDARKVNLSLTEKGSRVLERLALSHRDELLRFGAELQKALQQIALPDLEPRKLRAAGTAKEIWKAPDRVGKPRS